MFYGKLGFWLQRRDRLSRLSMLNDMRVLRAANRKAMRKLRILQRKSKRMASCMADLDCASTDAVVYINSMLQKQLKLAEARIDHLENEHDELSRDHQRIDAELKEMKANRSCVICLSELCTYMYAPCGHISMCTKCANNPARSPGCPMCRVKGPLMRLHKSGAPDVPYAW